MKLPDLAFGTIGERLAAQATSHRTAVFAGEVMLARTPSHSLAITTKALAQEAVDLGQIAQFFRDAAPHERAFRAFIDQLNRRTGQ